MSDCELIRVHLAARAAGDALDRGTGEMVTRHLARCGACVVEAERLAATARRLEGILDAPVAGEDEVDWDGFRATVLARTVAGGRRPWWRRPATGLAAAVLLLTALIPMLLRSRPGSPAGLPASGEGAAAEAPVAGPDARAFVQEIEEARGREQAVRLLRSGRDLLVGLASAPAYCRKDRRDLAVERDLSLRLLRQKDALDPHLARLDLGRSRGVCDELERVLRSVATLDDCPDPNEVRTILEVADSRRLLPRIDAALQGLEGGSRA